MSDENFGKHGSTRGSDPGRHKRWIVLFFVVVVALCAGTLAVNLLVDPLRIFSKDYDKSAQSLRWPSPEYIALRLMSRHYDYALLGSSRSFNVDVRFLHSRFGKDCINLGVGDASIHDIILLAEEVKKRGKHFICGVDAFILNEHRFQGSKVFKAKTASIQRAIADGAWNFKLFASAGMLRWSLDTLRIRVLGRSFNQRLDQLDRMNFPFSEARIALYFEDGKGVRYSDYTVPPDEVMIQLAKLADEGDIFIVYPKHEAWTRNFSRHGVDLKYFHALSVLVKHTRAPVYSFYGRYGLTEDRANFDRDGWHFRPGVSRLMFEKIFGVGNEGPGARADAPRDFGLLLTPGNVDAELARLAAELKREGPGAN